MVLFTTGSGALVGVTEGPGFCPAGVIGLEASGVTFAVKLRLEAVREGPPDDKVITLEIFDSGLVMLATSFTTGIEAF